MPPARKSRRWPWVLACVLVAAVCLTFVFLPKNAPWEALESPELTETTLKASDKTSAIDGVTYYFRPATREDHPTAISLENHFVLIAVEGTSSDEIYRVLSFVGDDMSALVTVVADGAFDGTDAKAIDLGYNVRYVWGAAFGDAPLADLYLHEDVLIGQATFSSCYQELTIHCPSYLENTEGIRWSELAVDYGFQWHDEAY